MVCCFVSFFFSQQTFEILDEDDASFILKVTQTLTKALVEYRQQAASNRVMQILFWFCSTNLQIPDFVHFYYYELYNKTKNAVKTVL